MSINNKTENISFSVFRKEVCKQLSREQLNELFFWSLIKKGHSEGTDGEEMFATQFSLDTRRKVILSYLKKSKKIQEVCKDKSFQESMYIYFTNEKLTNYILAIEIENSLKNNKIKDYEIDLERMSTYSEFFPDIIFKNNSTNEIVSVEVKGILSTNKLQERVMGEVIPHLLNTKEESYTKNFLLLLLFPCAEQEKINAESLIGGYYIYENIINMFSVNSNKIDDRKLLCFVVPEQDKEDNLEKITKRVINNPVFNKKRVA